MTAHWLRFEVEWLDPQWGTERTYIFREGGAHKTWTEAENALVREHFQQTPREEVSAMMPRRSWAAIMIQARRLKVNSKRNLPAIVAFLSQVSVDDLAFMREAGITPAKYRVTSGKQCADGHHQLDGPSVVSGVVAVDFGLHG